MTLGSHQRSIGASQVHITPRRVLAPLGCFDLDPCAADPRPWDCATENYTEARDGLALPWFGRVWLNPPFDRRVVGDWIKRMVAHNCGTALLHARTETEWFRPIWDHATGVLFLAGRLIFHKPDGSQQTTQGGKVANSGAPPVLIAFGFDDADVLACCGIAGKFVPLIVPRSVMAAFVGTWREAIESVFPDGDFRLDDLYRAFQSHPKAKANGHVRAKLRQTLARGGFRRVARGRYARAARP